MQQHDTIIRSLVIPILQSGAAKQELKKAAAEMKMKQVNSMMEGILFFGYYLFLTLNITFLCDAFYEYLSFYLASLLNLLIVIQIMQII